MRATARKVIDLLINRSDTAHASRDFLNLGVHVERGGPVNQAGPLALR